MESIKKLKEEMQFNTDLTELLDILKGIAVSEYWNLENKKERFSKFLDAFEEFFDMIDFGKTDHPFARPHGNLAIVVITTDEGFMGGLNNKVIAEALDVDGSATAQFIVIGERGASYLKALGKNVVDFPGIDTNMIYESAMDLKNYIMEKSLAGQFGRLKLFYPKSISFMVQRVEEITILPCNEVFERVSRQKEPVGEVIIESALGDILEHLVETWISQKLYEAFEDSKLSEFSARTTHLEESYQASLEQGKKIRSRYFKNHRELIDRGLRDMFSSQIIKKKQAG